MLSIVSIVCIAITLFYIYRRWRVGYFRRAGIRGPEPNFLFGNLIEYRKTPFHELLLKWNDEFGKVFGFYEGPTKNLVIGDPDLVQEIMVKQFSNFHGRKLFPMQTNPDKDERVSMFLARGKRWKRLRTTINPAFSHSKMRRMFPIIDDSIEALLSILRDQVVSTPLDMDVQVVLQRLTLDIICKCAFGVDTNCQKNVTHPFAVCLKKFLESTNFSTFQAAFALSFPEVKPIFVKLTEFFNRRPGQNVYLNEIRTQVIRVIEARRKNTEKRHDLLQLLLDSEVPGARIIDEENLCPMNDNTSLSRGDHGDEETPEPDATRPRPSVKPLTTAEIISQVILFLFAGYDTSSTALSYIMYQLALNPHIQRRLQQEVDGVVSPDQARTRDPLVLYDDVIKLPYLSAVIYEVLRFYPFTATVVNRLCLRSGGTYLSNGLHVPEGTNVIPNVYALHYDKQIWTTFDPYQFAPERFLRGQGPETEFIGPPHQYAWVPFGAGPRNCIGQRLAMMVMKSALAKFVHNFQVGCCAGTERPLQFRVGGTISPRNGVVVSVMKREH